MAVCQAIVACGAGGNGHSAVAAMSLEPEGAPDLFPARAEPRRCPRLKEDSATSGIVQRSPRPSARARWAGHPCREIRPPCSATLGWGLRYATTPATPPLEEKAS